MGMLKNRHNPGNAEEDGFCLLVGAPEAYGRISYHTEGSVLY